MKRRLSLAAPTPRMISADAYLLGCTVHVEVSPQQCCISLWCHYMETPFVSLALYEGNLLVTGWFPITKGRSMEVWCFSCDDALAERIVGGDLIQYIPRNMHTVFALLCFVVVIHWLIFPYPSGLLHWHCGNLTIAPVPAKQPWWIWINTSCEFIMNDCIITTKQSTTKPCAYFLGYTVCHAIPRDVTEMQISTISYNIRFKSIWNK